MGSPGNIGNPSWVAPAEDGSCPPGTSLCGPGLGTRCYALDHDPMNCGGCDNVCTAGIPCAAGVCQQISCSSSLSLSPLPSTQGMPEWPRHTSADMNGDGTLDLVEWSDSGELRILTGNGDGSFSAGPAYPAWEAAASYVMDNFVVVGDFNEDGFPDLAVSVPGRDNTVDVWLGNGDGTLHNRGRHGGQPLSNIFAGDVNRDGHLDVVISGNSSGSVVVLLGRGDGTFRNPTRFSTGESVIEVVIVDWNNDGIPDLLAMGSYLHLLLGTGDGTFARQQDCGVAADLRQNVIADFNGDGFPDLATLLFPSKSVSIMLGDGGCGLSARRDYATTGTPYLLTSGDVTGDGILDLVEVDGTDQDSHLVTLVGKGDGTFVPTPEVVVSRTTGDVIVGDYTGDKRADLLVSDGEGVQVLVNTCE